MLAYSILQNQADAQDAVSECIVRAFEKSYKSQKTYKCKIMADEDSDQRFPFSKSRKDRRSCFLLIRNSTKQVTEVPQDHLWSAILELSENVRVIMVLYYYDGLSVREISAMLNIPEGTTKTRLSAGRKQLAKWMENGKESGHVIR